MNIAELEFNTERFLMLDTVKFSWDNLMKCDRPPFYGYAFMINRINRLLYLIRHLRVEKIEDFFK